MEWVLGQRIGGRRGRLCAAAGRGGEEGEKQRREPRQLERGQQSRPAEVGQLRWGGGVVPVGPRADTSPLPVIHPICNEFPLLHGKYPPELVCMNNATHECPLGDVNYLFG